MVSNKRVPTKFWRMAYEEENLKSIIDSGTLVFPDFKRWPMAKNKIASSITSDLRVGSVIFLANFKHYENTGTVRAVGEVSNIIGDEVEMRWKKVVPSWSLVTHKIASEQWAQEAMFCFNVKPVKEFRLDVRSAKLLS